MYGYPPDMFFLWCYFSNKQSIWVQETSGENKQLALVTITLRSTCAIGAFSIPTVRRPVPREDNSIRGHSKHSIDAEVETISYHPAIFTPCTIEPVDKDRRFSCLE